jgi:hypothetical protein
MHEQRTFRLQSLLVALILNGLLLGAIFVLAADVLQTEFYTILGIGLLITLVLWFIIQLLGTRAIERAATSAAAPVVTSPPPAPPLEQPAVTTPKPEPKPIVPKEAAATGAVQMLSILQRQGRLVDFLQEDLTLYDDAQIGAAVRSIQENSKQALADYVQLEPIFVEAEGATVTIRPGFDPHTVRLTGAVVGEPPFRGELRHRGWRVGRIDLPERMAGPGDALILAPAEVEIAE